MIQEKVCLVSAPAPPARAKSYQAPSSLPPSKIELLRSASENQAVMKVEEKEIVKEEVLWTDAMVQDMFDCLDQARDHQNHDPRSHHNHILE